MTTFTNASDVTPRGPREGAALRVITDVVVTKVPGDETGGRYSVLEVHTAPGGGTPPHRQAEVSETFYVLAGEYALLVGDRVLRAAPGTSVYVPCGTVHAYTNTGDAVASMLVVLTPGGVHERFFAEIGAPVAASDVEAAIASLALPGDAGAALPDVASLVATAARHGVEIMAPVSAAPG